MSSNRVRTTTHIHLVDHPEASFRVRNLGYTSDRFHPSFTLDIEGDGSWADVVIHLSLPQLRRLRADLARAIEPAVAGQVSLDEAVQRG